MSNSIVVHIPTQQFRVLPPPNGGVKLGFFYARASQVPKELWRWRDVNPREVNATSKISQQIRETLTDYPEHFFERNRGLTVSAEEVSFDEKTRTVAITLSDALLHGVIDGAHTLRAILDVQESPPENGWAADVFVKVFTGVEPEQIAEIAGGLNSSQQVDLKSLQNLKGHFERLQGVLQGQPYAGDIAYKMNEDRPIDVREVLYYLAILDCSVYDANRHPTRLFGRKEGIVRNFANQAEGKEGSGDSFEILISRAPEILQLRDMLEEKILAIENVGRYKADGKTRIKSKPNRRNRLHFLNKDVEGKIPLGWIMPMLGGFRANMDWNEPKGSFTWKVPNKTLVQSCSEELFSCIKEIHEQEKHRPEHVGRNPTAWRICYKTVQTAVSEFEQVERS